MVEVGRVETGTASPDVPDLPDRPPGTLAPLLLAIHHATDEVRRYDKQVQRPASFALCTGL